ncbi:MAG: DUF2975 domain-containing protein [Patescibacteria group bacterium]
MKKFLINFLQVATVILGITVATFMLWMPHLEGRNVNAKVFEIYFNDPFLAYVYLSSISFFILLYKVFKLLGYIKQNNTFSEAAMRALRTIKHCAVILGATIVMAGVYIRAFHATEDDPAGFLGLCIVATSIAILVAFVASKYEKILRSILGSKSL